MTDHNIFAYTAPGADQPEYLSINRKDGNIVVYVRTKGYSQAAIMTLPDSKLDELIHSLRDERALPRPALYAQDKVVAEREQSAQQILAAIRKVRDGYADQAKFADIDAAVYFREFVRRLDLAVSGKPENIVPPWGGAAALPRPNRGDQ